VIELLVLMIGSAAVVAGIGATAVLLMNSHHRHADDRTA